MRAQPLVVAAMLGGAIAAPAPVRAELASIQAVAGREQQITVSTEMDAPAERVLEVFGDVSAYPRMFPNVKRVEVRRRTVSESLAYAEIAFSWPIGDRWLMHQALRHGNQITFHRTEGTFKRYDAILTVQPDGPHRCHATWEAVMDPGVPGMPKWLLNWIQAQVLPALVADAKRYLKDHARS